MRTPIIAGNWKMNKTVTEAIELVVKLKELVKNVKNREVVVAPPYTALHAISQLLNESNVKLAAQNMHYEDSGAFTGEISPLMLTEIGCLYVILGHSERRQFFGETDEGVNKKLKAALKHKLIPIVCCGETLQEREAGKTFSVIDTQINGGLAGISPEQMNGVIVAYEPVWAIGTGKVATPEQANEVHAHIRKSIAAKFGAGTAEKVRIQYGGSVKPDNVAGLMSQPDIDGALVGGASLDAAGFAKLLTF